MILSDNGDKISIILIASILILLFSPILFSYLDNHNPYYKYMFMIILFLIIGIFGCKKYKIKFIASDNGIKIKRIFYNPLIYSYYEIINYYDPIIATINNEFKLKNKDNKFKKIFEEKYNKFVEKNYVYYEDIRKKYVEIDALKEKAKNGCLIIYILSFAVVVINFIDIDFITELRQIIFFALVIIHASILSLRIYKNKAINREIKNRKTELKNKIDNMTKAYCA